MKLLIFMGFQDSPIHITKKVGTLLAGSFTEIQWAPNCNSRKTSGVNCQNQVFDGDPQQITRKKCRAKPEKSSNYIGLNLLFR